MDSPAVGLLLDEDDVAGIPERDRIAPVEPWQRQPAQVTSAEEVDALGDEALVLTEEHSQPRAPGAVLQRRVEEGRPVVEADPCEVSEGDRRAIPDPPEAERSCRSDAPTTSRIRQSSLSGATRVLVR